MSDRLKFFKENGYAVIEGALDGAELAVLNNAIDADRAAYPALWQARGEGGRLQSVAALFSSRAFDVTIRHAAVLPLVKAIMVPELCFEEFSVMLRQAYTGEQLAPAWHRPARSDPRRTRAAAHRVRVLVGRGDLRRPRQRGVDRGVEPRRRLPRRGVRRLGAGRRPGA